MVLVAHLVVKNEANRYLHDCLVALSEYVDHTHVFDDKSTDETPFLADRLGAEVHVRGDGEPSFLDAEGEFRQAAWESMGDRSGDWILCLDADEFLTNDPAPYAAGMSKVFHVEEVFDVKNGIPQVRVDGYWDQITAARLVPWVRDSVFPRSGMGCGSLPKGLSKGPFETIQEPRILHYGYAEAKDRESKYQRYVSKPGHNPRHVRSILGRAELKSFDG